jgi:hypothetical protein
VDSVPPVRKAASTRASSLTSRENSLWTPECLLYTRPLLVSRINACRRVKSGKVGRPPGVVGQPSPHHCAGGSEKIARLFEVQGSFGLHKSTPSARIP